MEQLEKLILLYSTLPQKMAETAGRDALIVSQDIIAQTKLRVLEGEDSEGQFFSSYSEGHKRKRKKAGRQTDKKDYFFFGNLSAAIHPYIVSEGLGEVDIQIAARGNYNDIKLRGAIQTENKKRGVTGDQANPINPSKTELRNAEAAWARRRERELKNILNNA